MSRYLPIRVYDYYAPGELNFLFSLFYNKTGRVFRNVRFNLSIEVNRLGDRIKENIFFKQFLNCF